MAAVHHQRGAVDGNQSVTEVYEYFNFAGTQEASASLETDRNYKDDNLQSIIFILKTI